MLISKEEGIKIICPEHVYREGWDSISDASYDLSKKEKEDLQKLYNDLKKDPYGDQRYRSYLKYKLDVKTGGISLAKDQSYSQTYKANNVDGGKTRYFSPASNEMIESKAFKELTRKNISSILSLFEFNKNEVTLGLHCVRYQSYKDRPSFSSPTWLHKDDEPIVIVNVINESGNLIGGDSIIAENYKNILNVKHLMPFEGIFLTKQCLHAVTPMEPARGTESGFRDILLTTIEEADDSVHYRKFAL